MDYTKKVAELVRKAEDNYTTGTTKISKYVEFSQYENIERILAYVNSKHISGDTDSLGREKPFFNIVNAARNLWYRATDIDRKDIRIKSTKFSNVLFSFIATLKLQEWMRKNNFGQFLNEWGRDLATFGSSPIKAVDTDEKLHLEVVAWTNLISDVINFAANPKIQKFDFAESELIQHPLYYKDQVKSLLGAKATRKTADKENVDQKADFYEVYEVHGYFPESWISGKGEDEDIYSYQMHVISYYLNENDEYEDLCLYKGVEEGDPFSLTHLIKENGREQSIGAVEHLFDAQWMQNHTVKAMKDQLDLSSKLIFQTADGNLIGQNVLSAMETGDILIHAPNSPLTMVNNVSHDIGALKTLGELFYLQGNKTVGATEAITGDNLNSNVPLGSFEIANKESHGLFEIMVENKGLQLAQIIKKHVIPRIKKELDTNEEIAEILSAEHIETIDSLYIPNEAIRRYNAKAAEVIFEGGVAPEFNPAEAEKEIRDEIAPMLNQRFIKPSEIDSVKWKDILKDIEWEVEVDITNEGSDRRVVLQTLNTLLQTIVSNPVILQDPNGKMLFSKILEETGVISSVQLQNTKQKSPSPIPQASGGSPKSVGELLNKVAEATTQ